MATKPKLDADLSGEPVDQTDYCSKIGSLIYLTSNRPDIVPLTWDSSIRRVLALNYQLFQMPIMPVALILAKALLEESKKQDCTAMSSAEAEYVAFLQVSAIAISCHPVQYSRTKHIHTRYHFIKEQVENGIIELAEMFTKALSEDRFQYLVKRIGMRCLTLAELEVLTNESA
ncbi:hypothetical protein Tco_1552314 [Tanacetum coccineum]